MACKVELEMGSSDKSRKIRESSKKFEPSSSNSIFREIVDRVDTQRHCPSLPTTYLVPSSNHFATITFCSKIYLLENFIGCDKTILHVSY